MNASELAALMLRWEAEQRHADDLRSQIEQVVLELGESQKVGRVVATYSGGTSEYDHETPVMAAITDDNRRDVFALIDRYTTPKTTWAKVSKELGVEPILVSKSPPKVTVRIKE